MTENTVQLRRLHEVVSRISYPGLRVSLEHQQHGLCLRVFCDNGIDNDTGEQSPWRGRPWPLDLYASNGEVVQTAFLAIMTALEHEARELFLFQGVRVMDPHREFEMVRTGEYSHVHSG